LSKEEGTEEKNTRIGRRQNYKPNKKKNKDTCNKGEMLG